MNECIYCGKPLDDKNPSITCSQRCSDAWDRTNARDSDEAATLLDGLPEDVQGWEYDARSHRSFRQR